MGLNSIESATAPKPPSMTLNTGNLAPRQPQTETMDTHPADDPAATFTRTKSDLTPNVYTDPRGSVHFSTSKGIEMETRVTQPTNPPSTPLSRLI